MDYYQGVVSEYLRANRATFINTEFFIETVPGHKQPPKGTSWYADAIAADFDGQRVYVCEITFSVQQSALLKKLLAWSLVWPEICAAIRRDAHIPDNWPITLWLFAPATWCEKLNGALPPLFKDAKLTALEETVPWSYNNFNRLNKIIV